MSLQSLLITEDSGGSLKIWLSFISTLIWQLIVVLFVLLFREQLVGLFSRIYKLKIQGIEAELQREDKNAPAPLPDVAKVLQSVESSGFFTREGIKRLVTDSGLAREGEEVRHALLLFQTEKQHTWLVATDQQMFCVLDDQRTRKSGKLIQWKQSFKDSKPVQVRPYKKTTGVVDLGEATDWLYSKKLHDDPERLKTDILAMFPKDS